MRLKIKELILVTSIMLTTSAVAVTEINPADSNPLKPHSAKSMAHKISNPKASHKVVANTGTINLNTADVKALSTLKGIGKKRAEIIVAYRESHGPFKAIEDLKNIKGIHQKVIDTNKDRLEV